MTTNYTISDIYKHKETLKPIEELKIYLEDIIIQIIPRARVDQMLFTA